MVNRYNSVEKKEARSRNILKNEFNEPAANLKLRSHSDQTHSSFHSQHGQGEATEPCRNLFKH